MKGDPFGVRHLTDAKDKKEANEIFHSTPELIKIDLLLSYRLLERFIRPTVGHKNPELFSKLYKSLVRPILEYRSPVWCPHLKKTHTP